MEDSNRKFVYDQKGQVCGYQCAICGDLIRTASGFKRHLSRKHGIGKQEKMFQEESYHPNLDCYEPEFKVA